MDRQHWRDMIVAASADRPVPVMAVAYGGKKWKDTAAEPVILACKDGNDYVVKGQQSGRMIVNEQIVGHLGKALGAPVGHVQLIDVPAELIAMQQDLQHMPAGVSHGSLLIKNCSEESPEPAHHDVPENRDRFAMLAVLFGWTHARDRQFIYSLTVPPLVYSVDHSHFLHGDPFWSTATLEAAPRARISRDIVEKCGLDADSLRIALGRLSAVGSHVIAEAVSRPPDSWSVTLDERVAAALYLDKRKSELLNDPRFRGLNDGS